MSQALSTDVILCFTDGLMSSQRLIGLFNQGLMGDVMSRHQLPIILNPFTIHQPLTRSTLQQHAFGACKMILNTLSSPDTLPHVDTLTRKWLIDHVVSRFLVVPFQSSDVKTPDPKNFAARFFGRNSAKKNSTKIPGPPRDVSSVDFVSDEAADDLVTVKAGEWLNELVDYLWGLSREEEMRRVYRETRKLISQCRVDMIQHKYDRKFLEEKAKNLGEAGAIVNKKKKKKISHCIHQKKKKIVEPGLRCLDPGTHQKSRDQSR
jgi:hypothetical protein